MFRNHRFSIAALTFAAPRARVVVCPRADSSLRLTSFSVPGANPNVGSFASGISANGTVVGSYADSSFVARGYIRSPNGTYTTINYPGTLSSGPLPGTYMFGGINNAGDATGQFGDFNNVTNSFIYHNGAFLSPQVAGSASTFYQNVNEAGLVGVVYYTGTGTGYLPSHAAIYDIAKATFTLEPDIAGYTTNSIQAILPDGDVLENVGNGVFDPVTKDQYARGSLTKNGVTTFYDYPDALDTRADAMTSTGLVSGNYLDKNHKRHGFVYDSLANHWYSIDGDPNATYTTLKYSNSDTQFAGYWIGSNGLYHSLLVTAVPESGTFALLGGVGVMGAGLLRRRRKFRAR